MVMLENTPQERGGDSCCNEKVQPHVRKLQEDGVLCSRKPEFSERKDTVAQPTDEKSKLAAKYGVEVQEKDGKVSASMKFNGGVLEIASADVKPNGLEALDKALKTAVENKQKEMEKTFGVTFSTEGEDVLKQWIEKPDCSWEHGPMIKARQPMLSELYGIERALYKAQPSHLSQDGTKSLKFYFLTDNYYKGDPALAYFIRQDKNGNQAVYFDPRANDGKPITEADAKKSGKHYLESIEALTHHEIFHNAQYNMGWDTPATKEAWAKKIGWLPYEDPKTHETKWIFKGKADDEQFLRDKDSCKDAHKWCACHKSGQLKNDKGENVDKVKDAKQFTGTEIQNKAEVRPSTWYFVNPTEMFAEGGMKFRLNKETRAELLTESPKLYAAVKEHDQEELNKKYGIWADSKEPTWVRSPEGTLVKNTPEAKKEIDDFEKKVNEAREQKIKEAAEAEKKKNANPPKPAPMPTLVPSTAR